MKEYLFTCDDCKIIEINKFDRLPEGWRNPRLVDYNTSSPYEQVSILFCPKCVKKLGFRLKDVEKDKDLITQLVDVFEQFVEEKIEENSAP